jgi:type I restriction enzyme M protein
MALISLAEIARRTGVERGAVSNWRRRHSDTFPESIEQGGRELFRTAEIADWLDQRTISRGSLLPGETEGSTYGDRFRATGRMAVASRGGESPGEFWARVFRLPCFEDFHKDPDVLLELLVLRFRKASAWASLMTRSARHPVAALDDFVRSKNHGPYPTTPGGDPEQRAATLLTTLHSLPMPNDDDGWSALVAEFIEVSAEWLGRRAEHHTPRSIVNVILGVTSPKPGDRICDPCCGTGVLLAGAAGAAEGMVRGHALFPRSARMTALTLELRGRPGEVTDDAEPSPEGSRHKYDVVLSNPPFNMRFRDRPRRGRFGLIPPTGTSFAWLCDAYERLAPGGRAAVVTANGSVFRTGPERDLRAAMIKAGVIDRIIAFPPRLFPYTGVGVTLWVLREWGPQSVLMVDGTDLGYMADRSHRRLSPDDVRLLSSVEPGELTRLVSLSEIQAQDFNLTPGRYLTRGPRPDEGETFAERVRVLAEAERAVQAADEHASEQLRRIARWIL